MFGLPDGVTACLFDMDGVVTQTATVHAAAWKEMFDGFLRGYAERTGTGRATNALQFRVLEMAGPDGKRLSAAQGQRFRNQLAYHHLKICDKCEADDHRGDAID